MAIVIFIVLLALIFGWLVPFIIGIVREKRGGRGSRPFVLTGGIWGALVVLGLFSLTVYARRIVRDVPKDFDFNANNTGGTGTIAAGRSKGGVLVLRGDGKPFRLASSDGNFKCPAGVFLLESYALSARDANGIMWTVSSDRSRQVSVRAGKVVDLPIGPPCTASVDIRAGSGPDEVAANLLVSDRSGAPCAIMANLENPPTFRIVTPSGSVLLERSFEYGCGSACGYSGSIPAEIKGKVIVRPVFPDCPFEVIIKDTVWQR